MNRTRPHIKHEIYLDPSTKSINLLGDEARGFYDEFFGSKTIVNISFTSYWEKEHAEPDAGFLHDYFVAVDIEVHGLNVCINLFGDVYDKELAWKDIPADEQEWLRDFLFDIAETCGEEPRDPADNYNEEVGYGPNDLD